MSDTFQVSDKINKPIDYNTKMIYNHFRRYYEAIRSLKISKNDIVIDSSCGHGYGSYVLSFCAKIVYGLDVNKVYLEKAKKYYQAHNIYFLTYKEYSKGLVDKIVFIETFEHIPKDRIAYFIDNLLANLKTGGDLFLTAPIGNDGPSDYNEHHLNEPSLQTLQQTFCPYFEKVVFELDSFINSFDINAKYCCVSAYDKRV